MIVMPRFEIYNHSLLIGWSELESGDPPMGVASGKFFPSANYAAIQSLIVASEGGLLPAEIKLSVRLAQGRLVGDVGDVHIVDYSSSLGADGIEVSVLGVSSEQYALLFPEHITAYEQKFKTDSQS
jgi:hypothetical protein